MSYNRAEYDTEALRHNFRLVRQMVGPERVICPAVKANGYGMGSVVMARIMAEEGAGYLAVALVEEGVELRKSGIDLPILVLGAIPGPELVTAARYDLTVGVFHFDTACLCDVIAAKTGRKLKVHAVVDTGMHRLGFSADERAKGEIKVIAEMPHLQLEGIFSHLSQTDHSRDYTLAQIRCFGAFCDDLAAAGVAIPLRHLANSNAILDYPESYFDMVRPGILLHGFGSGSDAGKELKEVLALKTRIVRLHAAPAGSEVSYGGRYVTGETRQIATLPIGYADGFFRALSGKAEALVRGVRVPQVGNICMDQCMLDVTGVEGVAVDDEVVLYGGDGNDFISLEEVARKAGTITYELLTSVKRVPKYYYFEDED